MGRKGRIANLLSHGGRKQKENKKKLACVRNNAFLCSIIKHKYRAKKKRY